MQRPIICLVTAGDARRAACTDRIRAAVAAGVDLVQIREPALDGGALTEAARSAVAAARGSRTRVVVNDRLDVALAAGAAGVHLRGTSFPALRARRAAPEGFLIGRSVHSPAEAVEAEAAGDCDYLVFGTVFPSASKPADLAPAGLAALRDACAAVGLPVLAIGGVSLTNVRDVAAAGAAGIAAITLFDDPDRVESIVAALRRGFDT